MPWNGSYPWYDLGVAMLACPPTAATCVPNQVTTCSIFGSAAPDDIVYQNVKNLGTMPLLYAGFDSSCISTIQGKTNYYHQDPASPSTHGSPACSNVTAAIHDSITQGICPLGIDAESQPPGVNADASNAYKVWSYNHRERLDNDVLGGSGQQRPETAAAAVRRPPADHPVMTPRRFVSLWSIHTRRRSAARGEPGAQPSQCASFARREGVWTLPHGFIPPREILGVASQLRLLVGAFR